MTRLAPDPARPCDVGSSPAARLSQVAQLIEIEKDEPGQGSTPQQILALVQVADTCMAITGHPVNLLGLMNHLATA